MEETPPMPAGPDAVPADGLAVHAAEETRKQRAYLSDNSSPDAKRQRGEDAVRVLEITASAAQGQELVPQAQVMQVLQQVLARLDGIGARLDGIDARLDGVDARLDNVRRRAHNLRTLSSGQALQPLRRELQQAAAGGAAAGDLPPDGAFPADRLALQSLTAAQVDMLEGFYGQPFEGPTVAARRVAFTDFATT